jgi:hypothetical protein
MGAKRQHDQRREQKDQQDQQPDLAVAANHDRQNAPLQRKQSNTGADQGKGDKRQAAKAPALQG